MGLTTQITTCVGGHIGLTHYEPGEVCRAHRHAGAQISLLLSGDYREDGSAGPVTALDGVLTAKPESFEHENIFGDFGALILSVNLDEAPFLQTYLAGDPPTGAREALLATAASGELDRLIPSVRPIPGTGGRDDGPPSWLDQAHRDLSVSSEGRSRGLARTAGVHPVTFARLFRGAFGRSPGVVRQSARTARAVHEIIRSRTSLSDVALDTGFSDQAHMTRTIGRATGYPPACLRRMFAAA